MGTIKNKFSWSKAIIIFLSFLFVISAVGTTLAIFRDKAGDTQENEFAPVVLMDDSFSTMKSQVQVAMKGQSVLVQPVAFTISPQNSSNVYVRAKIQYSGDATTARQKLVYESLTASTQPLETSQSYKWVRFGEYFYLCDSTGNLVSLSKNDSEKVFNVLDKENNIVPQDIVDENFEAGEKVDLDITLQSVVTSKVSSAQVSAAHEMFNTVQQTLANQKTSCSISFYDANGAFLSSTNVNYGLGATAPSADTIEGMDHVGWNTRSDFNGATLDAEDLSSVLEDLTLYAEYAPKSYTIEVIQPENGSISPNTENGLITYKFGDALKFTVEADDGYYIYGVSINDDNLGSVSEFVISDYKENLVISADIRQQKIVLDINGGSGAQPKVSFNSDSTKFVLSETEPTAPSAKSFYYYSTNPYDNEQGQSGIRVDLGVEYPMDYLDGNTTLYAIYLSETADYTSTSSEYVVIPKSETSISSLSNLANAKYVTLPRGVKTIADNAFKNLDTLEGISMSTATTSIGASAFEGCVSLESFLFGPFLNKIGNNAFKGCLLLSELKNFENIGVSELVGTFEECASLTSITIPSSVTKLEGTFKNCYNLASASLPNTIRSLGDSTFENCVLMTRIDLPATISSLGANLFKNCVLLKEVGGLANIYATVLPQSIFEGCESLQVITIPSNTSVIADRAFFNCCNLKYITNLTSTSASLAKVGSVGASAFENCLLLEDVAFVETLTNVDSRAFAKSGLKQASLSTRLESLGSSVFEDCLNLTQVTNLGLITTLEEKVFYNCQSLMGVAFPITLEQIKSQALANCNSLTSLVLPSSLQTITTDALAGDTSLSSITLKSDLNTNYNLDSTTLTWYFKTHEVDELSTKGYYTTTATEWEYMSINGRNYVTAYRGNKTSVTVPARITTDDGQTAEIYGIALIESYPFINVILEEGIQEIVSYSYIENTATSDKDDIPFRSIQSFNGMNSLVSITLPKTLTSLGYLTFNECSSLREVIGLENTQVTKIGDVYVQNEKNMEGSDAGVRQTLVINGKSFYAYAVPGMNFTSCQSLETLNLPKNLTHIGYGAFVGAGITELNLPSTIKHIGMFAFGESNMVIKGLENLVLDYTGMFEGVTGQYGLSGAAMSLNITSITLPKYAVLYSPIDIEGDSSELVIYESPIILCPYLEEFTIPTDWPIQFPTTFIRADGETWYLDGKAVTYAGKAGTYSIYPQNENQWIVDEQGYIIAYTGTNTTVVVPSQITKNGQNIQVVGIKNFQNYSLVDVTISEGVDVIDDGVFANMSRLKKVKLSPTTTKVGNEAFKNCSSLISCVLPDSVIETGEDIFENCQNIKIIISNANLSTTQILSNVSEGVWYKNSGSAGQVVTQMSTAGVYSKYESVSNTTEWEVSLLNNKNYITAYLGEKTDIIVPSLVVSQDYNEVYDIYGLLALKRNNFTRIEISSEITAIGLDADTHAPDGINEKDYYSMMLQSIGLLDASGNVYCPFYYSELGKEFTMSNLNELIIPETVNIIGFYAFRGFKAKDVDYVLYIPDVSKLIPYAFYQTKVETITLNENATKTLSNIPGYAFAETQSKTINIGYGVTNISNYAFNNSTQLINLNLPNSLINVGQSFDGCSSLVELNLRTTKTMSYINSCTSLERIILGANLASSIPTSWVKGKNGSTWYYDGTGQQVYEFNKAGTYYYDLQSIQSLWTYTTENGKNYITGYLGDSINVTVPSTLQVDGSTIVIDGIKSLNTAEGKGVSFEKVVVSEGIKEILANSFTQHSSLNEVSMPSTLTSIGSNAFSGTQISVLQVNSAHLTISPNAFSGMENLQIIAVMQPISVAYSLPSSSGSWTHITYSGTNETKTKNVTSLQAAGIYTTLDNVSTTNLWQVSYEGNAITDYFGNHSSQELGLIIPRYVIDHTTYKVNIIDTITHVTYNSSRFNNCVINLIISEGIEKIESSAFEYITHDLNSVITCSLPSTLSYVGGRAFDGFDVIQYEGLENTQIVELTIQVFANNYNLTEINLPASLNRINYDTLSYTPELKKIILNSNISYQMQLTGSSAPGNGIWYYQGENSQVSYMQKAGIYSSSRIQSSDLWIYEQDENDGLFYIVAYLGGEIDLVVPHEIYNEQTGVTTKISGVKSINKTNLSSIVFEDGIQSIGQIGASTNIFGGECKNLAQIQLSTTLDKIYAKALDGITAEQIVINVEATQETAYTLSSIKNTTWYTGKNQVSVISAPGAYSTFAITAWMPNATELEAISALSTVEQRRAYTSATIQNGYDIDDAWYIVDGSEFGAGYTIFGYLGTKTDIIAPHYVLDFSSETPVFRKIEIFIGLHKDLTISSPKKVTLQEGYSLWGYPIDSQDVVPQLPQMFDVDTIEEIVLPSSLISLGYGAFYGYASLQSINIEDTQISRVPYAAFANTPKLQNLTLPGTVDSIENFGFYNTGLVSLNLNEGLMTIADYSIISNQYLKSLVLPTTLSVVTAGSFSYAEVGMVLDSISEKLVSSSIEKIVVKKELPTIINSEEAFMSKFYYNGSQALTNEISKAGIYLNYNCYTTDEWTVSVVDGKNWITSYVGKELVVDVPAYVYDRASSELIEIYGVKSINNQKVRQLNFREGIKEINNEGINLWNGEANNTLTYINLPSNLIAIEQNVFNSCNALETINVSGDLPTELDLTSINPSTWHYHELAKPYLLSIMEPESETLVNDVVAAVKTKGGYSTYSMQQELIYFVRHFEGGYGIVACITRTESGDVPLDVFIPAYAFLAETNILTGELDITFVPVNTLISLRLPMKIETNAKEMFAINDIGFNSMTIAEGINRVGDIADENTGMGTGSSYYGVANYGGIFVESGKNEFYVGSIVTGLNHLGSENRINVLGFDGSFENATVSGWSANGGTLSIQSSTAYAGSKSLYYGVSGASKAQRSHTLEAGTYVFEAMVKSSATSLLQVQVSDGSSYKTYSNSVTNTQGDWKYAFVKFDVEKTSTVLLNLPATGNYDCMSLYKVDKGLPTTLKVLGANAFAGVETLKTINLTHTALTKIEQYALSATFKNTLISIDVQKIDGDYIVDSYSYDENMNVFYNKGIEVENFIYDSQASTLTLEDSTLALLPNASDSSILEHREYYYDTTSNLLTIYSGTTSNVVPRVEFTSSGSNLIATTSIPGYESITLTTKAVEYRELIFSRTAYYWVNEDLRVATYKNNSTQAPGNYLVIGYTGLGAGISGGVRYSLCKLDTSSKVLSYGDETIAMDKLSNTLYGSELKASYNLSTNYATFDSREGYVWSLTKISSDTYSLSTYNENGPVTEILIYNESNNRYMAMQSIDVWTFDAQTQVLQYNGQNYILKQTSDGLYWGSGFVLNANTNRLETPSDGVITQGYILVDDTTIVYDTPIALPKTLQTIGYMGLNTGATRYLGLDQTQIEVIEVGAFGIPNANTVILDDVMFLPYEGFGSNLIELSLPETFSGVTYHSSSDTILFSTSVLGFGSMDAISFTMPTNYLGLLFAGNENLKNIYIGSNNGMYASVDGVLYSKDLSEILAFPRGRRGIFTLETSTQTIGEASFFATGLKQIILHDELKEIKDYAFTSIANGVVMNGEMGTCIYTTGLESIIGLENTKVTSIGRGAFASTKINHLVMPQTLQQIGGYGDIAGGAFMAMQDIQTIKLTSNLVSVYELLYAGIPGTEWFYQFVTPTDTMQNTGYYSTYQVQPVWEVEEIDGKYWISAYLGSDTDLFVPQTVLVQGELIEVYGIKSFKKDNLTSVSVGEGIKAFGLPGVSNNILGQTDNGTLSEIDLPYSVSEMTAESLNGLYGLTVLKLDGTLDDELSFAPTGKSSWYYYNYSVTRSVSTYKNVGIYTTSPLQFVEDGEWEVNYNNEIVAYNGYDTVLTVPAHLYSIEKDELIRVEGISSFGRRTEHLNKVSSITVSEGIKYLGENSFDKVPNITQLNLPNSLEIINANALSALTQIKTIVIPAGVSNINTSALPMQHSLETIELEGTLISATQIPNNVGSWFYNDEPTRTNQLYGAGVYKKLRYTIKFEGNGGTTSDGKTYYTQTNMLQGITYVLEANKFNYLGQKFLGWSTNKDDYLPTYLEMYEFSIANDVVVESSTHTVILYAIWDLNPSIAYLNNNWSSSKDTERGYSALKLSSTSSIEYSLASFVLEDNFVVSGMFSLSSVSSTAYIASLSSGSLGVELRIVSGKPTLYVNGSTFVTGSKNLSVNVAYSFIIIKTSQSIQLKLTTGDDISKVLDSTGANVLVDSTNIFASSMQSSSAIFRVGYNSNNGALTIGTFTAYQGNRLAVQFVPNGTSILRNTSDDGQTLVSTTVTVGGASAAAKMNAIKMIPAVFGRQLAHDDIPQRFGRVFAGYTLNATKLYDNDMNCIEVYPSKQSQVLYAEWDIIDYSITYKPGNGANGTNVTQTVHYEEQFTVQNVTTFTKTGYSIDYWMDNTNTKAYDIYPAIYQYLYKGNLELTAHWKANNYLVTFDPNGGTTPNPTEKSVTYDSTYGDLAATSKTGYTFLGWFTQASGGTEVKSSTVVKITSNQTLYAHWSANTYNVTANANGGTIPATTGWTVASGSKTATKSVTYDSTYGTLPTPTRTGYTFDGWYTNPVYEVEMLSDYWTVYHYSNRTSHAYYTGDSTVGEYVRINALSTTSIDSAWRIESKQTFNVVAGQTYTFTWYARSANALSTQYFYNSQGGWQTRVIWNDGAITYLSANVNFTNNGAWQKVSTTITVPSGKTTAKLVIGNDTPNLNGSNAYLDIADVSFYIDNVNVTSSTKCTTASAHTLYAKWVANTYTINYAGNGATSGSTASSSHVYDFAKQTTAEGFTKAYTVTYNYNGNGQNNTTATATYTFAGWKSSVAGGLYGSTSSPSTSITSSTKIPNQSYVTNLTATNKGTVTFTAQWTSASVVLPTPTRTGYTLSGWYTAATGGTKRGNGGATYTPTSAETLYAQWTANTYTITYDGNGATSWSTGNSTHTYDQVKQITAKNGLKQFTVFYDRDSNGTPANSDSSSYDFDGWTSSVTGGQFGSTSSLGSAISSTSTVIDDGSYVKNVTASNGANVTFTAKWSGGAVTLWTPTKVGYTFNGWYDAKTGGNKVGDAGAIIYPTAETSLWSRWTANSYTVTANANGGTIPTTSGWTIASGSKTATKSVTFDSTYGTLPTPTRTGYTFSGWYLSTATTTSFTYAYSTQWSGGWSMGANKTNFGQLVAGQQYIIVFDMKASAAVSGWNQSTIFMNDYTKGIPLKNLAGTSLPNLTTSWQTYKTNAFTYTLDNEGSYTNDPIHIYPKMVSGVTYYIQNFAVIPANTDVSSSATIVGQYTSSSVNKTAQNHTLHARWTINKYNLVINPNSGSYNGTTSNTTINQNYNSSYTFLNATRTGYTFVGWHTTNPAYMVSLHHGRAFDGTSSGAINLGRTYMYTDKISFNMWGYMDDWSQYTSGMRLISCTEGGGFNIENASGKVQFAGYDSGVGYKVVTANTTWASLSSGWHMFTFVFDGTNLKGYLDGTLFGTSATYTSGKMGYHASNVIWIGAEANGTNNGNAGSLFKGNIQKFKIENTAYTAAAITSMYNEGAKVSAYTFTSIDVNMKAIWSANKYTVTFDKNGGTGGTDSVVATYAAAMPTATAPTKTGHTFKGYYYSDVGGTQYYTDAMASAKNYNIASNVTMIAKWVENKYEIKLSNSNATTNGTAIIYVKYGIGFYSDQDCTIAITSITSPARTHYTFGGYKSGTTTIINSSGTISATNIQFTANTTLNPTWTRNTYTIKLGTLSYVTNIKYGTSSGSYPNTLTTSGSTFNSGQTYYFQANIYATTVQYSYSFSTYTGTAVTAGSSIATANTTSFSKTSKGGSFTLGASATRTTRSYTVTFAGSHDTGDWKYTNSNVIYNGTTYTGGSLRTVSVPYGSSIRLNFSLGGFPFGGSYISWWIDGASANANITGGSAQGDSSSGALKQWEYSNDTKNGYIRCGSTVSVKCSGYVTIQVLGSFTIKRDSGQV